MLERRWWWASRRWRTSTGCSTACPPPPLLDIVACTTTFPKPRDGANKHKSSKQGRPMTSSSPPAPASTGAHVSGSSDKGAPPISEVHDMAASLLVEFYYYSLTHLTSPVDFIRRKEASGAAYEGDYFKIEAYEALMKAFVDHNKVINQKDMLLGIHDDVSWHAKLKDSTYVFGGGDPFDLTKGDLLTIFTQLQSFLQIIE
ncbi:uncharacterized protein [Miscanthus floridulus]|uniref:uncharacterized protein isoform X1 n=1 Tax=Miscanthus floridulus TaxID=154761 RepID=UPI0034598A09